MLSEDVLEEAVEHLVGDLLGTGPVDLVDLLGVGVVGVEAAELALLVAEEQQEVRAVAPVDDVQHVLAGVAVHGAREHHELDGVQDDGAVRLARGLAVQPRAYGDSCLSSVQANVQE